MLHVWLNSGKGRTLKQELYFLLKVIISELLKCRWPQNRTGKWTLHCQLPNFNALRLQTLSILHTLIINDFPQRMGWGPAGLTPGFRKFEVWGLIPFQCVKIPWTRLKICNFLAKVCIVPPPSQCSVTLPRAVYRLSNPQGIPAHW